MKKSDKELYALLYNTPDRKCNIGGKILPYTECINPGEAPITKGVVFIGNGTIHSVDEEPCRDGKVWDFYDFPS